MLTEIIITCVSSLIVSICVVYILETVTNAYIDGMKLISKEENDT